MPAGRQAGIKPEYELWRAQQPWRRWYRTARWRQKRADQLAREPWCRLCLAVGRQTQARVADHVIPHRGDEALFWNGALQSLCETCHNAGKRRAEHRGGLGGCGPDGWPVSDDHPWNAQGGGGQILGPAWGRGPRGASAHTAADKSLKDSKLTWQFGAQSRSRRS